MARHTLRLRALAAVSLIGSSLPLAEAYAQGQSVDIAPVEVTAKKQKPKPAAKAPAKQVAAKPAVARPPVRTRVARTTGPAPTAPRPAQATPKVATASGTQGTPTGVAPAFAGGQVATGGRLGILGNTDVKKAPFNITSYTEQFIRDRQAATLSQALTLDPSVRAEQTRGATVDAFFIRGFPYNEGNVGEFGFDGLYGIAPNSRIFTDYAERIEVIKGPSAAISGVAPNGAIGGVINIVPKRAGDDLTRITSSLGSIASGGAQFDIARRYGTNREFGVRVVGSGYGGHTPIDRQSERTGIGYLSLDYQGDRFRSWFYMLTQADAYTAPSRPFLAVKGITIPGAPDGQLNISQPWEYSRQRDRSALLKTEYDLLPNITAFADVGGALGVVNRFFGNPSLTSSTGNISNAPGYFDQAIQRYTYDGGVRANFDTGAVHHAGVVQYSLYHDLVDRQLNASAAYTSNIFVPVLRPVQVPNTSGPRAPLAEDRLTGLSLVDTASILNEHVLLTAGVRRQEVLTNNFVANVGTLTSSTDKYAMTPLAALVVRPTDNLSFYGNFVEGLSRGDVAPTVAVNSGSVLAPYISRQYEVGVKAQYGTLGTSLAAFQITKALGELSTTAPLVFAATGLERVRGIEFNVYGEVRPGVRALGGFTYLAGTLLQTAVAANIGNNPIGVPHAQLNIGGEYDLPWLRGATLNGAVIYTGREFADSANLQPLSSWARLDLGSRYVTTIDGRKTTFRFNVENVTGTNYYTGVATFGTFFIGSPRSYQGSISVDL